MNNIVKLASEFVSKLLNENLPSEFTYHNLIHAREVFEAVTELGKNSGLPDEELEIIQVAAWFHDTGFIKGYLDHEYKSIEIVKEFLENICYPDKKTDRITEIIIMTEMANIPSSLSDKIIKDADILHIGKEDCCSKCLALKSELESIDHKKITESEWLHSSLDFINGTLFFTDYAKSKYEEGRQKNISRLNEMIKKLSPKDHFA
jgi:HD superfamily phosphodiesterase